MELLIQWIRLIRRLASDYRADNLGLHFKIKNSLLFILFTYFISEHKSIFIRYSKMKLFLTIKYLISKRNNSFSVNGYYTTIIFEYSIYDLKKRRRRDDSLMIKYFYGGIFQPGKVNNNQLRMSDSTCHVNRTVKHNWIFEFVRKGFIDVNCEYWDMRTDMKTSLLWWLFRAELSILPKTIIVNLYECVKRVRGWKVKYKTRLGFFVVVGLSTWITALSHYSKIWINHQMFNELSSLIQNGFMN